VKSKFLVSNPERYLPVTPSVFFFLDIFLSLDLPF